MALITFSADSEPSIKPSATSKQECIALELTECYENPLPIDP